MPSPPLTPARPCRLPDPSRLDRAGRSDAKTAKMLYVSSVFLEVLRQWSELSEDLASKQRYAAWRAGELSAAAREGRAPPPPTEHGRGPRPGVGGDGERFRNRGGLDRFRGSTSWGAHRRGTLAGNNPRRAFRVSAEYHLGTHSVPAAAVVSQPGDDGERDVPEPVPERRASAPRVVDAPVRASLGTPYRRGA